MVQPRTKYQSQMDLIRAKGLETVHVFHVCKNITESTNTRRSESKQSRAGPYRGWRKHEMFQLKKDTEARMKSLLIKFTTISTTLCWLPSDASQSNKQSK